MVSDLKIIQHEIKTVFIETAILQSKKHPKNPKYHPPQQIMILKKLIEYQGFRVPIIISNLSGFIVSGHARLEAASELNIEKIPVIYQDFKDEEAEYSFLVSDNTSGLWGNINLAEINAEISQLEIKDLEMLAIDEFMFSDEDKKTEDKKTKDELDDTIWKSRFEALTGVDPEGKKPKHIINILLDCAEAYKSKYESLKS